MGKLTMLLKKKRSRGDELMEGQTKVDQTGNNLDTPPLSLMISTSEMTPEVQQQPLSLMDDIMDQLAGTTPDTPQPCQGASKSDLSDFGLVFELSRQLELGASTSPSSGSGPGNKPIGKLQQNSAFKDNAFIRSQQQLRAASNTTPTTVSSFRQPGRSAENAPSFLRGSTLSKEAEEKAEASARLREASKKANAQLPSDDEGSDLSDSDESDEPDLLPHQQLQLQHEQLILAGKAGSPRRDDGKRLRAHMAAKQSEIPIKQEDVIDRMKDRHRALLAGAAAAARDEYYEEYMDDYGHLQQVQQPGPIAYNVPYGMDPAILLPEDYRLFQQQQQHQLHLQQQQQQYYINQGLSTHPHNLPGAMGPAPYNQQQMNPAYPYHSGPAHVPGYITAAPLQQPVGGRGPLVHLPATLQRDNVRSGSTGSDISAHTMNNGDSSSPRRASRQQSTSSSARVSEDSWAEPYPVSSMSTQKTLLSDSGCGGSVHHKYAVYEDGVEGGTDTPGSEYEKTKTKVDDVAKVIEVLSISKAAAETELEEGQDGSEVNKGPGSRFEDPESLKGSSTMLDSVHGLKDMATVPSSTPSVPDSNDNDNESSDDDQPIILSRRGSARGPILPKLNTNFQGAGVEYGDDAMVTPVNNQAPYMPHGKNMYQPIQGPASMGYPQQHPLQQTPQHHHLHHPGSAGPISLGYQFPTPHTPTNMGHHHSYSVDRIHPSMLAGPISAGPGGPGVGPGGPMSRHGRQGFSGSKDLRQGVLSPQGQMGHYHHASPGQPTPIQSQYPIPPTTLLHPLPRRSQSVRVRGQNVATRMDSPSTRGMNCAQPSRGSIEITRLPNGGYQSMGNGVGGGGGGIGGPGGVDYGPYIRGYAEPLSPPQQHQQLPSSMQHMMSPPLSQNQLDKRDSPQLQHIQQQQQQQQQAATQGFYTTAQSFGYGMHPADAYPAHPHQPILQAGRR